jgi:membrane-bound lytic murein transglycosylase B
LKLVGAALVVFITVLVGMSAALAPVITGTALVPEGGPPSQIAVDDIPPRLLAAYQSAAAACPGLPWTVAAGIGKVESNHARFGGAIVDANGVALPPIIGIPLDGTSNTARIWDTDGGVLDGDLIFDRAVGPFQFIPSSWAIFGVDGDRDGLRNPHDVDDAIPAMIRHLCPNGQIRNLENAIFSYNRSDEYVAAVLSWANRYAVEPKVE